MKETVNFEIPKEDLEEVCHLLRTSLASESTSNDVWVMVHKFCNEHVPITDFDYVREYMSYALSDEEISEGKFLNKDYETNR